MTAADTDIFNVLEVKLEGTKLIEAAAGTGKTYSIAIMVLRWILETENKIDSVLAVTFTNYATAELKERILAFLEGALAFFEPNGSQKETDETIRKVCRSIHDKEKAVKKLRAAINDFDAASISTIHGFCQKLIREHAFELGTDFDLKLSEDTDTAKDAATTFFRENISNSILFETEGPGLLGNKDFKQNISRESLYNFISKAGIGTGNTNLKIPVGTKEVSDKLTEIYKDLLLKAPELAQKNRNRKNLMGYDDILLILYEVLKKESDRLRKSMEERYSLVLIDEFQDTDPMQYSIFKKLFMNGKHTVFFIGDPKQSIYAFRKADIFTYLETANTPDIKKYVMGTNFRSSSAAVEAANDVFSRKNIFGDDSLIKYEPVAAAKKTGEYALLNNGSVFHGLLVREIPDAYKGKNVKNQDDVKEIMIGNISQMISELVKDDSAFKIREKDGSKDKISERPVSFSDIAILVARNDFALEVCKELIQAGIPAAVEVEPQQQLYIFLSEEAEAVQKLIHAASSDSESAFRTLLLTFFYNKSVEEIADESGSLPVLHEKFRECFADWENKGFYYTFSKFIGEKEILANIAKKGRKTIGILRQLSELIHKHEFDEGSSPLWTQKWFDEKMNSKKGTEEENIRAENEKKECVRIMTLHKSKGLEFNIVFFPMIIKQPKGSDWFTRHIKTEKGYEREMIFMQSKNIESRVPGEPPFDENLEENRRIYVALTRARYLTVCYTQKTKGYLEPTSLFEREEKGSIDTCRLKDSECEILEFKNREDSGSETELLPQAESGRRIKPEWAISSFSSINSNTHDDGGISKDETKDPDLPLAEFPRGAEAGNVLHSIFEKADFRKDDNTELVESILKKKMNFKENDLKNMVKDVERCLQNVFSAPIFPNDRTLRDIPEDGKITEMEFFIKTGDFETQQLSEIIKENYHTYDLEEGSIEQGFLHGFIDLVAKINGKYYIIDWKSNNLGGSFSDYDEKGIKEEMKKHNYYLQYMLYLTAFDSYMHKVDSSYSYEKDFGGIRYVFLRGIKKGANATGIYSERPDESELRKIQELLKVEK